MTAAQTAPTVAVAVTVRKFAPDDAAAWDGFVRRDPQGTFFHLAGWRSVLERAFGHRAHYLLAEDAQGICGVLPLAHVKSLLFGSALVSTPFCVYGGALAVAPYVRALLEDEACELARRLDVDYLELRNRERSRPEWPSKDLYVTFRKRIEADANRNLEAIPRKQRAMVRKAIGRELTVEIDGDCGRLYPAYAASLRNLGTPVFSRRYLELLREVFADDCEVQTVLKDGRVLASVLSFYFRDEVLPYYGGGHREARNFGANDFMYWKLMERAAVERGTRLFDYGRSKRDTGSYRFKVNWGFEPAPLHYEYFLVRAKSMPNLSPTNPKYRLMIAAWKRMPLWLAGLVGPPLARHLG
ncbi:MAG TPA: FemAB family XrtA/PEP-CTERM system-associated protein [Steroidobacteraceae bacterium]|nr:FemAB family XrtA/PEP-CTERM system-associated protein [Steroidobacteraceae bacterium]